MVQTVLLEQLALKAPKAILELLDLRDLQVVMEHKALKARLD
jgi:hypothetical protein